MTGREMMMFFPALGALVVVSGTAYVALDNINDIKSAQETSTTSVAAQFSAERSVRLAQIADIEESVDANEADIEEIKRLLIQRDGDTRLTIQRIESKQTTQDEKLNQMLELLKELQRRD